MVSAANSYLDKGTYRVSDVARILRTPYNTVRDWLSKENGIVERQFPDEQLVGFLELMEMHFIKLFRSEGVSLQAIRKAALVASERFDTQYPFAVKRFDTDGRTIFATLVKSEGNEELVEDLRRGQYVFKNILSPFFRKLSYDASLISQYWPLGKGRAIVLDPCRQFGRPIDNKSGITTHVLFSSVQAGESVETVAAWYGVTPASVKAAVEFERSLVV
jgi:uncharacterized protein (DUF433 family)